MIRERPAAETALGVSEAVGKDRPERLLRGRGALVARARHRRLQRRCRRNTRAVVAR